MRNQNIDTYAYLDSWVKVFSYYVVMVNINAK